MSDRVWDSGLQPERTALAWRRIGMGLLAIGLALPRVTFPEIGVWCLPASVLAVLCGAFLLAFGHRRYHRFTAALTATDALASGGRLPLTVAVVTLVIGLTALATLW